MFGLTSYSKLSIFTNLFSLWQVTINRAIFRLLGLETIILQTGVTIVSPTDFRNIKISVGDFDSLWFNTSRLNSTYAFVLFSLNFKFVSI